MSDGSVTLETCYVQKGRAKATRKAPGSSHIRTGVSGVCRSEYIINCDFQTGKQAKHQCSHLLELQPLSNTQQRRMGLPEP